MHMGWCGQRDESASRVQGVIDPCTSESISAALLACFAIGALWAGVRKLKLLHGPKHRRQNTSQIVSLVITGALAVLHCAGLILTCISTPAPYDLVYQGLLSSTWILSAVRMSYNHASNLVRSRGTGRSAKADALKVHSMMDSRRAYVCAACPVQLKQLRHTS